MTATAVASAETAGAQPLLEVDRITLTFGGVRAVDDVSIAIGTNQVFSLIGPNGAGKTSLINCITGYYRPNSGRVRFEGEDITRRSTHAIARIGIARTYQNIELFQGMSVIDNLLVGRHRHMRSTFLGGGVWYGPARREELRERRIVEELVDFLEIAHVRSVPVGKLPYGMQKRVDLGRALAVEPRLLILDEPMAGMNVEEKEDIARFVLEAQAERDLSILLIEHDMGVVMDVSDRVAVLDFGKLIAEGPPEEIREHPAVIEAYVGEQALVARHLVEA